MIKNRNSFSLNCAMKANNSVIFELKITGWPIQSRISQVCKTRGLQMKHILVTDA